MSKNTRAIYGDDDQEKLLKIFDQEEEIQKLVDVSNRQLMKKRLKEGEKKKAIIDTTTNAVKPEEFPEDITETTKPEKQKKEKKEEKKKKEKKTLNPKGVKNVITIFILAIVLLVVFNFRKQIISTGKNLFSSVSSLISSKTSSTEKEPEPQEKDIIPLEPTQKEQVEGYMDDAEDKEYTLIEILDVGTSANTALQNYYNSLVIIATESKTSSVADKVAMNDSMVEADKSNLESYRDKFLDFPKGEEYYNSLLQRFDHLQNLIDEISWVDESKINSYINRAITEENEYILQGKNALIAFLDANNKQYTVTETSVVYEVE